MHDTLHSESTVLEQLSRFMAPLACPCEAKEGTECELRAARGWLGRLTLAWVISDKVTSLLPWQVQPVGTEDCVLLTLIEGVGVWLTPSEKCGRFK